MYYIHVRDIGFSEPPWPGERRLGPYDTEDEANAQATHDIDMGLLDVAGVFSDKQSTDRHDSLLLDYFKSKEVAERKLQSDLRNESAIKEVALSELVVEVPLSDPAVKG